MEHQGQDAVHEDLHLGVVVERLEAVQQADEDLPDAQLGCLPPHVVWRSRPASPTTRSPPPPLPPDLGEAPTEFEVGGEAAEGRVDDVQAARLQLLDHHLERAMATRSPGELHCALCGTCALGAARVVCRVVS